VKLCVFGLGYVGCVSAAVLASRGHRVIGVDLDESKVAAVAAGEAPIVEPGLDLLLAETVADGSLSATTDGTAGVQASEASLVCVGTPSGRGGEPSTEALERVVATIGGALARTNDRHTAVIRSTILPGTCERLLIPLLEQAAGRHVGENLGFVFNPEFLREGSSIADFRHPPKTVIGEADGPSGETAAAIYRDTPGPLFRVPVAVAEMVKYADNFFHALKVCFANEIGASSRAFGLDSHQVMDIFKADERLNISTAYLTPGFAFGGSCLTKDVRALAAAARREHLDLPILENVIGSNEAHLRRAFELVTQLGERRIGMFGLAFKSVTDDLRESPFVELAERLIGKGFDLKIHDPTVAPAGLVGANRRFVEERLPHLSALLVDDPAELLEHAQVLVIGNHTPAALHAAANSDGRWIVDLVRIPGDVSRWDDRYLGIAW
jgi:GDP-mannose 6-dehydrogenase